MINPCLSLYQKRPAGGGSSGDVLLVPDGTGQIYQRTPAGVWSLLTTLTNTTDKAIGLAYGNGTWLAVGQGVSPPVSAPSVWKAPTSAGPWTRSVTTGVGNSQLATCKKLMWCPVNGRWFWLRSHPGGSPAFYKSADGIAWTQITITNFTPYSFAIDTSGNLVVAGDPTSGNQKVIRSTDGGANWSDSVINDIDTFIGVSNSGLVPSNDMLIHSYSAATGIKYSSNGGAGWGASTAPGTTVVGACVFGGRWIYSGSGDAYGTTSLSNLANSLVFTTSGGLWTFVEHGGKLIRISATAGQSVEWDGITKTLIPTLDLALVQDHHVGIGP